MSQPNLQCMGIDVAKLSLDIATTDTIEPFTVGNDEDGFAVITDKLDAAMLAQLALVIDRHPDRSRYIRHLPDEARAVLGNGRPSSSVEPYAGR